MKINSIEFLEDDNEREITVSIGEEKVHITPCHESYEQWGQQFPPTK
jgi:hypothetical protein